MELGVVGGELMLVGFDVFLLMLFAGGELEFMVFFLLVVGFDRGELLVGVLCCLV